MRRRFRLFFGVACAVGLLFFEAPRSARANPAFARQSQLPCRTCHTAFPDLNPFGRTFKEAGYRFDASNDPAGPWAMRDALPFGVQAIVGATGTPDNVEATALQVDALQLFMGGPIAPHTSAYVHHHIILANEPGPLHEAQVIFDHAFKLPVMVRFGKFEPWLAQSPGKTIFSHFGFQSVRVNVGENTTSVGDSRFALGTLWLIGDTYRIDIEGAWNQRSPEVFVRPFAKSNAGEVGVFGVAGYRDVEGEAVSFRDRYERVGADAVLYPAAWMELAALALQAWDQNPDGSEVTARYGSGYLEAKFFPAAKLAGLLRYEQVYFQHPAHAAEEADHTAMGAAGRASLPRTRYFPLHGAEAAVVFEPDEPTLKRWIDLSLQPQIHENVKLVGEYLYNVDVPSESLYFVGTHVAF